MQHRHLVFMLMNAIAIANAMGQEARHGGRRPPPPTVLAHELGLDAAQASQFVQILEQQRARHRALQAQADAGHAALRQQLDALHEETRARLRGVLDVDQLARFEQLRPAPPGPPPREGEQRGAPPEWR